MPSSSEALTWEGEKWRGEIMEKGRGRRLGEGAWLGNKVSAGTDGPLV